jgi:hypothetical protein
VTISLTSPVTGSAQTGFTAPTYTVVALMGQVVVESPCSNQCLQMGNYL